MSLRSHGDLRTYYNVSFQHHLGDRACLSGRLAWMDCEPQVKESKANFDYFSATNMPNQAPDVDSGLRQWKPYPNPSYLQRPVGAQASFQWT